MSVDDGISEAALRYASRSAAPRTAPDPASETSTFARSLDDGTVPAAAITACAIAGDFAANGTAFTSTRARSPLDGMFATALKYAPRSAVSSRPRYGGATSTRNRERSRLLGTLSAVRATA